MKAEIDSQEFQAVKSYRLNEKKRAKNRRAQAAWYNRQRQCGRKQDAASEVAKAWERLEAERAAFAAERQAWFTASSDEFLSQQSWVAPSAEGLRVSNDDSFRVAVKKLGFPEVVLDVIHSVACQGFSMCGFSLPTRDEVDSWTIHNGTVRVRTHIPGIARLLHEADSKGCRRSLARVTDLMSSIMNMMKLVGATDRSTGCDLARIMLRVINQLPYEQHGQPPAFHWHKAAAGAQLSAEQRTCLLALQDCFHERLCSIRQRSADLPSDLHAFLCSHTGPSLAAGFSDTAQVEACEALLADMLKEEHAAASKFYFGFRTQVLTGLQNGRLYVASAPYQPDIDAICTALRGWDSYPALPLGAQQQQQPPRCIIKEEEQASTALAPGLPWQIDCHLPCPGEKYDQDQALSWGNLPHLKDEPHLHAEALSANDFDDLLLWFLEGRHAAASN
ncbi:hypothetical protein WJX73_007800 [Symbiochloris irregularis]|uniref:BZIP domain-containing protein n=1 Tax=Symbiochloris irregularis TaxID=706552 RepID=A0AAW1NPY9_9CHLO